MSNQGGTGGNGDWPSDDDIKAAGWVKVSRRARRIQSAPRPRQYYWVDFPHDAFEPEFVGEHPGIVIRGGNLDHSTCIIVPVTSREQDQTRFVHQLPRNPNPKGQADGKTAYVICDHVYTINICRLRPLIGLQGQVMWPKIEQADFARICELVGQALFPPQPAPKPVEGPVEAAAAVEGPDFNAQTGRKILKLRGLSGPTDENH